MNNEELNEELKDSTDIINDEFGGRKGELVARLDDDLKNAQEEIYAAKLSGADQAGELREIVRGHEDIKKQQLKDLEAERKEAIDSKKREISAFYLAGAKDDNELKNQLQDLLGADEATMNEIIKSSNQDKQDAESELKRRLDERRAAKEKKLKERQEEFNQEIENQDPEDYEMIEARNYEETKKLESELEQDGKQDGIANSGTNVFDNKKTATGELSSVMKSGTFGGLAKAMTKKIAMKEESERKRIARDRHHDMSEAFDAQLAGASLMA